MLAGRASGGYSIDYLVSLSFEPFKPQFNTADVSFMLINGTCTINNAVNKYSDNF
jgi:hypothetical protein